MLDMKSISNAFNAVRGELTELGLLYDGVYLDAIECCRAAFPSGRWEKGYVFDDHLPWYKRFLGWEEGVIYIPSNAEFEPHTPGLTLRDVIRHEFGHAWAWLDRAFFEEPWFKEAFGRRYWDEWPTGRALWREVLKEHSGAFEELGLHRDFVSEYACDAPYEDFAETFMTYLRYRRSLSRFRKRPGAYRKLRAVEAAVKEAAARL